MRSIGVIFLFCVLQGVLLGSEECTFLLMIAMNPGYDGPIRVRADWGEEQQGMEDHAEYLRNYRELEDLVREGGDSNRILELVERQRELKGHRDRGFKEGFLLLTC